MCIFSEFSSPPPFFSSVILGKKGGGLLNSKKMHRPFRHTMHLAAHVSQEGPKNLNSTVKPIVVDQKTIGWCLECAPHKSHEIVIAPINLTTTTQVIL
jgi:hypothetical protein